MNRSFSLAFESGGSNLDQFEVKFINGDYVNKVEDIRNGHLSLSPNPTGNFLTLDFNESINADVKIIDLNGIVRFEGEITNSHKFEIDTSQLSSGAYIINITEKGSHFSSRFIKI